MLPRRLLNILDEVSDTVAILAQGTNWAVAASQAFFMFLDGDLCGSAGSKSPPRTSTLVAVVPHPPPRGEQGDKDDRGDTKGDTKGDNKGDNMGDNKGGASLRR